MSVRYPIAQDAGQALSAPLGRAARGREAAALAGAEVEFVREPTGPVFQTRDAAQAAYADRVDGDTGPSVAPEDRYCELIEMAAPAPGRAPRGDQAEPAFANGRRWPKPRRLIKTVWRLTIGYWRLVDPASAPALPQARAARRGGSAQELDPAALQAMARQPLQPVKPQQPLDIGLFEVRLPDAPHIVMPDE